MLTFCTMFRVLRISALVVFLASFPKIADSSTVVGDICADVLNDVLVEAGKSPLRAFSSPIEENLIRIRFRQAYPPWHGVTAPLFLQRIDRSSLQRLDRAGKEALAPWIEVMEKEGGYVARRRHPGTALFGFDGKKPFFLFYELPSPGLRDHQLEHLNIWRETKLKLSNEGVRGKMDLGLHAFEYTISAQGVFSGEIRAVAAQLDTWKREERDRLIPANAIGYACAPRVDFMKTLLAERALIGHASVDRKFGAADRERFEAMTDQCLRQAAHEIKAAAHSTRETLRERYIQALDTTNDEREVERIRQHLETLDSLTLGLLVPQIPMSRNDLHSVLELLR